MPSLSHFVTSPSSNQDAYILTSSNFSDSPLRSPHIFDKVRLGAIQEDEELSGYSDSSFKANLSMPHLNELSSTDPDASQRLMAESPTAEAVAETVEETSTYGTNGVINDAHDSDAALIKLTQTPIPPTKKAKRTKHRRSTICLV